jgi:hypothetical protein
MATNAFCKLYYVGKDVPYLEFFRKLKDRADIVVAAQELCLFRIVDGSNGLHNVTRIRTADNDKDLEITEWKRQARVCSNNDKSYLLSENFPRWSKESQYSLMLP